MMIHMPEKPMTKEQFSENWKTVQRIIERLQELEAKVKPCPVKLGFEEGQLLLQGAFQEESRLSSEAMHRILYPVVENWKPNALYAQGIWIKTFDPEGIWVCRVTHTSQDFLLEQKHWEPLLLIPKDRGAWSDNIAYQPGDQIHYQGCRYRCRVSCIKQNPTKGEDYWYKIWHDSSSRDTIINVETHSTSLPTWAKPLIPIFISDADMLKEDTLFPDRTLALVQHTDPAQYVWMIYLQKQWIPFNSLK